MLDIRVLENGPKPFLCYSCYNKLYMANEIPTQQFNDQGVEQDYQRIVPMEKAQKLEELKKMALEEGIAKAVFIAKKMDDPYLLDELHDALTDELKQRLISEGKLEKL